MATTVHRPLISVKSLALLASGAIAFALVSTIQAAAYLEYSGSPIPWVGLLKARIVNAFLYASFVPLLYRLALARPVTRDSWPTALPLHLLVGLICALIKEALFTLIGDWFRPGVFRLGEILAGDYFDEVLFFWAMTAAIHAYLGWQRMRPIAAPARALIDHFVVSGPGGYRVVRVDDIEWIEAQGNYAQLNASDGRHLVRETMASLERGLGENFVRVHRGAIVNRSLIERIEPRSHGSYAIFVASGRAIVTSRSFNSRMRALLR